jgi:hypothetical protein
VSTGASVVGLVGVEYAAVVHFELLDGEHRSLRPPTFLSARDVTTCCNTGRHVATPDNVLRHRSLRQPTFRSAHPVPMMHLKTSRAAAMDADGRRAARCKHRTAWCNIGQGVATSDNVLQHRTTCCNIGQHGATSDNVLQHWTTWSCTAATDADGRRAATFAQDAAAAAGCALACAGPWSMMSIWIAFMLLSTLYL